MGALLVAVGCSASDDSIVVASDAPRYDGTQASFATFVEEHGKSWPVPTEMSTFQAADGTTLRYAHWAVPNPEQRAGTVVFFQGRTEFIEKNIDTYQDLLADGYDVWTLDWRGQGLSDRLLDDRNKGHIDSFDTFVADAERFVDGVVMLDQLDGRKVLLAHSMGGAIGTLYLLKHPGRFDRAVFTSPLIGLPAGVEIARLPNWIKVGLGGQERCTGFDDDCPWTSDFAPQIDPCELDEGNAGANLNDAATTESYSHDAGRIAEIDCLVRSSRNGDAADPGLGLGGSTSGWLRAAFEATDAIGAGKTDLETPLLIVGAGGETIVDNADQAGFCDAANPACCRLEIPDAGHEILIEAEVFRARFMEWFREFTTSDVSPKAFCAAHTTTS